MCLGGRDQAGALAVGHQRAELATFARRVLEPLPDLVGSELGQLVGEALDNALCGVEPGGVKLAVARRDRLRADRWVQPGFRQLETVGDGPVGGAPDAVVAQGGDRLAGVAGAQRRRRWCQTNWRLILSFRAIAACRSPCS